jgi:hypothetical protein
VGHPPALAKDARNGAPSVWNAKKSQGGPPAQELYAMKGKYKSKKNRKDAPSSGDYSTMNTAEERKDASEECQGETDKGDSNMNKISRWWNEPAHVIQSVGIGIGTIVALIYAGQLCAMLTSNQLTRDALKDGREHFTQDQRPYVWIAGTPSEKGSAAVVFGRDSVSGLWGPNVSYKNYGKTPAIHVRGDFRMVTGEAALSKVKDIDKIPTKAGGSIEVPGGDPDVTDAQLKDLLNIDMGIVVYGRIDYSGTDGTEYWSKFCLVRQKNGGAGYCPGYSQIR